MSDSIRAKIALFCDVDEDAVLEWLDVSTIYDVPNKLLEQGIIDILWRKLQLDLADSDLWQRNQQVDRLLNPKDSVTIAIAGKYNELCDAYISVVESLRHAGAWLDTKVNIQWINTEAITNLDEIDQLVTSQNIAWFIVPWWFGHRWVEGKILVAQYCREHWLPYLGLCLGLQVAVIEYARHVAWLHTAHSTEFAPDCDYPVIAYVAGQSDTMDKWGTMRLWAYDTIIDPNSQVGQLYVEFARVSHQWGQRIITERHRHRYEVNPAFVDTLSQAWLNIIWTDLVSWLVEYIELSDHPYFVATQAHPEFTSRLERPHPLFVGLVRNSIDNS